MIVSCRLLSIFTLIYLTLPIIAAEFHNTQHFDSIKNIGFTKRQSGEPTAIYFSPDNQILATRSTQGTIDIWDIHTKKLKYTLRLTTENILSASFSPSCTQLATGSNKGMVHIWNIESGKLIHTLIGIPCGILSTLFSPDGQLILAKFSDGSIEVWHQSGILRYILPGTLWLIRTASFSPDNKFLITGSDDGTTRIWNAYMGNIVHTYEGHTSTITSSFFSSDMKAIITSTQEGATLIRDIRTGNIIRNLESDSTLASSVNFSHDGRSIVTGFDDTTACVWDQTQNQRHILHGSPWALASAFFSPNDQLVIGLSLNGKAYIWDTHTATLNYILEHTSPISAISCSSDGQSIATGSNDGKIQLWHDENARKQTKQLALTLALAQLHRIGKKSPAQLLQPNTLEFIVHLARTDSFKVIEHPGFCNKIKKLTYYLVNFFYC